MAEGPRRPTEADPRSAEARSRYVITLGLVCALQLVLTLHFVPPSLLFADVPLYGGDYSTHAEQAHRVLEGLEGWHRSWVYDARFLGGFPNGTIFDADNKGWELFTFVLHRMGVPEGLAFNLFVLLSCMLLPLVLAGSARVWGLGQRASVMAALLGTLTFFFDSLLHWLLFVGTIAFVFAAYLCTLALGLFLRFLRDRRGRDLAWLTLLLGLIHLVHPYAFFVLAPPMLFACVKARASLGRRELLLLAVMSCGVIACNAFWILPALQHFHYILDSSYLMSADLRQIALDFFELLSDVSTTGVIANHTGFRTLGFGLAAIALWPGARSDWAFAPTLRATLLWLCALAYLGDHIAPLQQIQPYRFIVPAIFFSLIAAAQAIDTFVTEHAFRALGSSARAFALLSLLLIAQHLSGEVLYFFPSALPRVRWFLDLGTAPISATGFAPHPDYRIAKGPVEDSALVRFANAHRAEGRFAVQDAALGEELARRSEAHVLGGFWFCNVEHSRSNLFRRLLDGPLTQAQIRTHLIAYNIRYVVLSYAEPRIEDDASLFVLSTHIGRYKIYKTKIESAWLSEGTGVVSARTNRIQVEDSDVNQALVLRFHFHEALVCNECRHDLQKVKNPIGGVPFIRVPAPHPSSFVIENSYRF